MRDAGSDRPEQAKSARSPKYSSGNLIKMLRLAARLRNEMIAEGFTDNGGAIHSAERILNLLGLCLNYPNLSHGNNLRYYSDAESSINAQAAHKAGQKVLIEHVSPIRDFTRRAIECVDQGAPDEELEQFVRSHYRLVLLTPEETTRLNKLNRSKMVEDRLGLAGIQLYSGRESV